MKVKKAIIPAGGLGTRVLPATKAQPKEMLAVVDKPILQYLIEELIESGITEILIVTGRNKQSIENHFDYSYELETLLKLNKKNELLDVVQNISNLANIYYIRQKFPLGLGHAIKCGKSFVGNEPFLVLLGDDIVYTDKEKGEIPVSKQLIEAYNNKKGTYIGVQEIPKEDVSKYGIIKEGRRMSDKISEIDDFIEKPKIENSPSNIAALGRYILEPEIFDYLEKEEEINGEIQLTPAILKMAKLGNIPLYSYNFDGLRYDTGDKFGLFKANVEFALRHPELKNKVKDYLESLK